MAPTNNNQKNNITKVLSVWEKHNNISNPRPFNESIKIVNRIGNFFAAGSFFYYIFNFESLSMDYVSESVKDLLGISPDDFSLEALLERYHPEDLKLMHVKEEAASEFLFHTIDKKDIMDYKVVYLTRYKDDNGLVKKILHQAQALNVTENGKIQHVLGVHTDITYLNTPVDHKVSFISQKNPSYFAIDPEKLKFELSKNEGLYTPQEIKIIKLIADGKSSNEIAQELFISEHTVRAHKKNILSKSSAKNSVQLVANCIREGII
jgi:DNA-binding NarL/FixJ family response regulator